MESMLRQFKVAKKKYDNHQDATNEIRETAIACLRMMQSANREDWSGPAGKRYTIFSVGENKSRPFLTEYLISESDFPDLWERLLHSANPANNNFALSEGIVTRALYNIIVPFCVCFDLWKPKSRKTPGTFFEVVLGTMISMILPPTTERTKHIQLPIAVAPTINAANNFSGPVNLVDAPQDELLVEVEAQDALSGEENDDQSMDMGQVATDIVFDWHGTGIVIPAKITTRERIVQPFAHQRILDGVFGEHRYVSLLICVSETQRSDVDRRVNEICVPGTITLFQRHLAKLGGIYYLDPPERYLTLGRLGIVPVQSLGSLLTSGLASILTQLNLVQPVQRQP